MLQKIITELRKINNPGSFVRNVSIASSWNTAIILLQLVLSPIITRLYAPSEYGLFALYNSIVLNIILLSSLRYTDAIVVVETRHQRNNIVFLCINLLFLVSSIVFLTVYLFQDLIIRFIDSSRLGSFVYIIPFAILVGGIIEILLLVNVSRRKFYTNGFSGFILNLISRATTIGYGTFAPAKAIGLVGGDLLGKIASIIALMFSFNKISKSIKYFLTSISLKEMKSVAKMYVRFPFYILPNNIIISLSGHLPIYFLQVQFDSAVVGSFALASSLLEIINRLIPYSVASVFFPKAMELKKFSEEKLFAGVYKLYWLMLVVSIIIFSFIAILGESIFPWIFGDSWLLAGKFLSLLCIQYAFNFVAVSLAEIYKVIDKQKFLLVTTVLAVFLKIFVIYLIIALRLDASFALILFGVAGALGSILQVTGIFFIFNYRKWKVLFSFIFMMLVLLLFNYLSTFN